MTEALHYSRQNNNSVKCELCPHECHINIGSTGICGVRRNDQGTLIAETYGIIASSSLDPIEKKPLYHYHPGKMIYSIGSYGCNLKCIFCQNHEISQVIPANIDRYRIIEPVEVVQRASIHPNNIGIAFTYNEPIISFEYILEIAKLSHKKGLKNIMVSNGFINQIPLIQLLDFIDAFNIDLKSFSNDFYKKQTKSSLYPVLESLKIIKKYKKHLEITFLVIPELNDDKKTAVEMFKWIATELGEDTVLHLSRYYPSYNLNKPATPNDTLFDFYELASKVLHYVYLGNIPNSPIGHNTTCKGCSKNLVVRNGYHVSIQGIDSDGKCTNCASDSLIVMN